jgi:hypothetical protein
MKFYTWGFFGKSVENIIIIIIIIIIDLLTAIGLPVAVVQYTFTHKQYTE